MAIFSVFYTARGLRRHFIEINRQYEDVSMRLSTSLYIAVHRLCFHTAYVDAASGVLPKT